MPALDGLCRRRRPQNSEFSVISLCVPYKYILGEEVSSLRERTVSNSEIQINHTEVLCYNNHTPGFSERVLIPSLCPVVLIQHQEFQKCLMWLAILK